MHVLLQLVLISIFFRVSLVDRDKEMSPTERRGVCTLFSDFLPPSHGAFARSFWKVFGAPLRCQLLPQVPSLGQTLQDLPQEPLPPHRLRLSRGSPPTRLLPSVFFLFLFLSFLTTFKSILRRARSSPPTVVRVSTRVATTAMSVVKEAC